MIRVGIYGAGFMAGMHGKRLLRCPGVTLAGLCARSRERAAGLREKLQATDAVIYDDLSAMLDSAALDALYICIPPYANNGQAEMAAARGVHLFLEKPIALDTNGAESIVAAVEQNGVHCQVGYHNRFRDSVQRLKAAIDSGEAGRPTLFHGRYWANFVGADWWRDRDRSGGQIYEQVIHIYDMALYLFGTVDSASGFLSNLCHQDAADYTVEDTSVAVMRFRSGALGTISGSNCALPNHFIGDWRVVCERATLDYRSVGNGRDADAASIAWHSGPDSEIREETFTETGDVYLRETERFLQTLRGEASPIANAREALDGIRLVSALRDGGALA